MKKFSTILCMGLMLMAVSTLAAQDKKSRLSVLSFTDEIQLYLDAEGFGYKDTHPDVNVNYVHVPTDQFPGVLDEYLSSGKNVPDVIGLEDAFVRKYVESGCLLPLDDLYKEVKSKMNDYPIKVGTYNGHVYALSWDICPGAMFYRRSLAKKYWGTDDPKEVQKKVASFDSFLKTARELNKKSNGRCKMVSTFADLFMPSRGARKKPWVVDDKLYIDPAMEKYMEMYKIFYDEELDICATMWSDFWYAGMNDYIVDQRNRPVEIMCYFLPTWGLHYVLEVDATGTAGDWAMCAGPSSYRWGGTWLAAYKGTNNPDAAKEMIRYLTTDDKFLENIATRYGCYVGNLNVQKKIKDSFSSSYLAGQNPYKEFCELAKKVNGNLDQATDMEIESLFSEAVTAYVTGELSKKDALDYFKKSVRKTLGIKY